MSTLKRKSKILANTNRKDIESKSKKFLNNYGYVIPKNTKNSTRAVGDGIEKIIRDNFYKIFDCQYKKDKTKQERKAMGDFSFTDNLGFTYIVDVKTHRLDTDFNMPNLTSVKRLADLYKSGQNFFVVLKVDYKLKENKVDVKKVTFAPIEFFDLQCLTLGALGWGQIQIANANNIRIDSKNVRAKWMLEFFDKLEDFYLKEIIKTNARIKRFQKEKKYWQNKCSNP